MLTGLHADLVDKFYRKPKFERYVIIVLRVEYTPRALRETPEELAWAMDVLANYKKLYKEAWNSLLYHSKRIVDKEQWAVIATRAIAKDLGIPEV